MVWVRHPRYGRVDYPIYSLILFHFLDSFYAVFKQQLLVSFIQGIYSQYYAWSKHQDSQEEVQEVTFKLSTYLLYILTQSAFNRLWAEFAQRARAHRTRLIERQMVILKSCDKTDHNGSCEEDRYRKAVTRTTSDS